jgi:hypothetical protein
MRKSVEPIDSCVVDGFGDVETEIEATVIASSKDKHEFSRFMFDLGQFEFWKAAFEGVGVDESCLVSQVLTAPAEMFREMLHCLFFEDGSLTSRKTIPKFGLPLM